MFKGPWFDVYLSDRRDHLLVVAKGQSIPIHQSLARWYKKRAAAAVSEEIRIAVQKDGYYSRRIRKLSQAASEGFAALHARKRPQSE